MSDQGGEEAVRPIRHRLAVRPILVSLSVRPKHPQRPDKKSNVPSNDGRRQTKHEPSKSKPDKREAQRRKARKVTAAPSKQDPHFLVQIPNGPLVRVPTGVPYCRIQHGKYKYSLNVDPVTGKLRHVHKKPT